MSRNPGRATAATMQEDGLHADDVEQRKEKKQEVVLGKGRMMKVFMLTRPDAIAVANALEKPGVLEALAAIGRQADLPPEAARLVRAFSGDQ